MDQLRKALKTSEICMTKPENLYLLVKILNSYLFFYGSKENTFVEAQDINDLLSFIKETIDEMEGTDKAKESLQFLENTKQAIREKRTGTGQTNFDENSVPVFSCENAEAMQKI